MTNPISGNRPQISDAQREQFAKTRQATMAGAADALGETPEQLQADLSSGKSLSDIATAKGVSPADLQKSIETAVKSANPSASADQVSKIAQRAISGHHHRGGHHAAAPEVPATPATPDLPPDATISIKV